MPILGLNLNGFAVFGVYIRETLAKRRLFSACS